VQNEFAASNPSESLRKSHRSNGGFSQSPSHSVAVQTALMSEARGRRLRQARLDQGYESAAEAARALGVPYPTYAGHENGSRDFGTDAMRYAHFYRVHVEWLLNGTGPRRAGHKARVQEIYDDLPEERRTEALRYLEFLKSQP